MNRSQRYRIEDAPTVAHWSVPPRTPDPMPLLMELPPGQPVLSAAGDLFPSLKEASIWLHVSDVHIKRMCVSGLPVNGTRLKFPSDRELAELGLRRNKRLK
jgi:hypothetical protein